MVDYLAQVRNGKNCGCKLYCISHSVAVPVLIMQRDLYFLKESPFEIDTNFHYQNDRSLENFYYLSSKTTLDFLHV